MGVSDGVLVGVTVGRVGGVKEGDGVTVAVSVEA